MARLDEQLVQVQRARGITGRERHDAGDLPVGWLAFACRAVAVTSANFMRSAQSLQDRCFPTPHRELLSS